MIKDLKENRNIKKDIFIITSIIILSACIFCMNFYSTFLKFQMSYFDSYNYSNLKNIEELYNNVSNTAHKIAADNAVTNYIFKKTVTPADTVKVNMFLENICQEENISNILIINDRLHKVCTYSRTYSVATHSLDSFLKSNENVANAIENYNNGSFCMLTDFYDVSNKASQYISFFFKDYSDSIVIISVTPYFIADYLSSKHIDYPIPYSVILQNNDNQILFVYHSLNNTIKDAERYIDNITPGKTVFSFPYVINSAESNSFSITSLFNISDIITMSIKSGGFMIVIVTLISAIMLLCFYLFSYKKKIYKYNIQNQYTKLVSDISNSNEILFNSLITYKLFHNDAISASDKRKIDTELSKYSSVKTYALIITIDNQPPFENQLLLYGIQNIVCEIFNNNDIYTKSAVINNTMLGLLIYKADDELSQSSLLEYSTQCQQSIKTYLSADISIMISTPKTTFTALNFHELYECIEYKFINGKNSIIFANEVKVKNDTSLSYPQNLQTKIITAVKSNNRKLYLELLDEFYNLLIQLNYKTIRIWCINLFINIDEQISDNTLDIFSSSNTLSDILKLDYLDDIIDLFKNTFCTGDIPPSQNEVFIQFVNQRIYSNYPDSNFTSNAIAEELGLTNRYFCSKFKTLYNTAFTTYLREYRLKKAAELLVSTQNTNAQISNLCGFNSETYFNSSFKTYFGITPKEYRLGNFPK